MSSERVRVQAEGWNHYIERHINHRWPPVLRAWFPEGSERSIDWTSKFFQYVFPLEDPRSFRPPMELKWSDEERSALGRYLAHAQELAAASVLTAQSGYRVHMATPDAKPVIKETKSPRDATVGFLAMFRQFYAIDELASFKRASDLLMRELKRVGANAGAVQAWRTAQAKLRHTHLDHLILVRAAADGLVSAGVAEGNSFAPNRIDSPEHLISVLFYGDAIHWGEKRSVIEAWDSQHAVIAVKTRFDALRCAVHLGHLYVAFAAVVALATQTASAADL